LLLDEITKSSDHAGFFFFASSLLDDMDQRKTDLLDTQLLVEQLEQREQMLEAQIDMLQVCIQELPSQFCSATDLLFIRKISSYAIEDFKIETWTTYCSVKPSQTD